MSAGGRSGQLELTLAATPAPVVVVTRALGRHRFRDRVLARVAYARRFFPELAGQTIRVGLTRAAAGMAVPGGNEIWINPARTRYHTVAHELIHLLQRRDLGIPMGERSCDVYSLARHWTLNDSIPSYLRVPALLRAQDDAIPPQTARLLYDLACDALRRRAQGERRYIAYFEKMLGEWVASGSTRL